MQINRETPDQYSIQSYDDNQIIINQLAYHHSLIVSRDKLILDWPVTSIHLLNQTAIAPLLSLEPELIIIGHKQPGKFPPLQTIEYLSKRRIGIECMPMGSACRTFNVLLSEQRAVVLGIVLSSSTLTA
jgi:uncharacterized protein